MNVFTRCCGSCCHHQDEHTTHSCPCCSVTKMNVRTRARVGVVVVAVTTKMNLLDRARVVVVAATPPR